MALLKLTLIFSSILLPFCSGDLSECTRWLHTNGSDCNAPQKPSSFRFSWGSNWTSPFHNKTCCNDGTGCFSIERNTPYHCHEHLPHCMDEIKPEFFFYTPQKKQEVQMIDYFNLENSVKNIVDENRPFFVIIHGFGGDWPKDWMFNMKDRLVNLNNNVMIVRWTTGAKDPKYFTASANTRTVGAAIGKVVKALDAAKKVSIANSTIIGFSLGGQIAGFAGSSIPNLRRILAIDPAGPMFQCMPPEARLDPSDAHFVQAIHTNGDYFLMGGCGTLQQFGHMDIYMNGGSQQPGCPRGAMQSFTGMSNIDFNLMVDGVSCSHNRVPKLLVEIIELAANPDRCQFSAFPCNSQEDWLAGRCFKCPPEGCPNIGYSTDLDNRRSGKFYVSTLADNETSSTFCGTNVLVTLQSAVKVKGSITLTLKYQNGKQTTVPVQTSHDVMTNQKSFVAAIPFNEKITEVHIEYHRNKLPFTGGPNSWQLTSLTIQDLNGSKLQNQDHVEVQDAELKTIPIKTV